jgi:hypothetical protein
LSQVPPRASHDQSSGFYRVHTATGVTEFEADDAGLVPYALVAVTAQVYAVPFVNPETVIGLDDPSRSRSLSILSVPKE